MVKLEHDEEKEQRLARQREEERIKQMEREKHEQYSRLDSWKVNFFQNPNLIHYSAFQLKE